RGESQAPGGYNRRVGEDRRPSLWKSLKRALAGAAPAEPATGAPRAPSAQIRPDVDETPPFLAETEPAPESLLAPPPIPKPDLLSEESRKAAEVPPSAAKE